MSKRNDFDESELAELNEVRPIKAEKPSTATVEDLKTEQGFVRWKLETVPTSIGVCHKINLGIGGKFPHACIYDDCGQNGKPNADVLAKAQQIVADHNDRPIHDALMIEGSQKIDELREQNLRLEEYIKELNTEIQHGDDECRKHHGEGI
jgi:hypothetical protein